ncbi:MAG: TatD family hydrolase [Puniceicoccales bacterium]|jgi:TatD DNase family protein|nr:TatD family hydrolase [Puniceicoccales bacterium]
MPFPDAHNHLQDPQLASRLDTLAAQAPAAGVERVVVNGTSEHDWPRVAELARRWPHWVIPAFGLHPWHSGTQSAHWLETLRTYLEAFPCAPVGEIGLDHSTHRKANAPMQEEALAAQLVLARELARPVVLHCVKASGALETALRGHPLPRGFLMHGYSGSAEQMKVFASLGGWFSCSGQIFDERQAARRAVFQAVPLERLLVETDAPNMAWPEECRADTPTGDNTLNLPRIYAAVAHLREMPADLFSQKIAENFARFFQTEAGR